MTRGGANRNGGGNGKNHVGGSVSGAIMSIDIMAAAGSRRDSIV